MTATQTATIQVFLRAFRSLSKTQRKLLLGKLLHERSIREDLLDVATIQARRHESARPLRDYLASRPTKQNK